MSEVDKPNFIDTTFRAHCPQCGDCAWWFTGSDDNRTCATDGCGYVHHFRGPQNEPAKTDFKITKGMELLHKRERVRQLVFALIATPKDIFQKGMTIQEAVNAACQIDDAIEAIDK